MKTDSQLQQVVMAELKWGPAMAAAQTGVEAKGGVKALAVEMKVKPSEFDKRTDADIATRSAWGSAGAGKVVDKLPFVYCAESRSRPAAGTFK